MSDTDSLSNSTALRDGSVQRRVRHLGSARDGLREWRLQRLTALALIPLGLYFTASLLRLATSDRVTAAEWLSSPVPALLVILFLLAGLAGLGLLRERRRLLRSRVEALPLPFPAVPGLRAARSVRARP